MSKIVNNRLKGKSLATSKGLIQFDAAGVANIEDEELVEKLLELKGYALFEGSENAAENPEKEPKMEKSSDEKENTQKNDENTSNEDAGEDDTEKEDASEENAGEDAAGVEYTEESLSEKNVPQLKKVAKDNNIDLNGATKKDEIIAIILGALNN